MKAKKRIGTRAFKIILLRDYGVNISEGRILRLLKSMTLPKMSTIKPRFKSKKAPLFSSDNLLKQEFNRSPQIKFGQQTLRIFLSVLSVMFISALFLTFTLGNVSLGK
ncbi:hypothetical protein V4HA_00293 [Lactococcus cremoris]|nr:hypothetical protein [Lactococcus cremoris]